MVMVMAQNGMGYFIAGGTLPISTDDEHERKELLNLSREILVFHKLILRMDIVPLKDVLYRAICFYFYYKRSS